MSKTRGRRGREKYGTSGRRVSSNKSRVMCLPTVRSQRGKEKRGRRDELNDDSRHAPRTRYTMLAAATTTRTRRTTKRAEEVSNKREKKRTQGSSQKRLAIATVEPSRVESSPFELRVNNPKGRGISLYDALMPGAA